MTVQQTPDSDLCHNPNKHDPHVWGWRKGRPIPCPGKQTPDPTKGATSRVKVSAPQRKQDALDWIQRFLGVSAARWGDETPHVCLYEIKTLPVSQAMIAGAVEARCAYPACGNVRIFRGEQSR